MDMESNLQLNYELSCISNLWNSSSYLCLVYQLFTVKCIRKQGMVSLELTEFGTDKAAGNNYVSPD